MSRTNHNTKGPGYEYWSRRPGNPNGPGKQTKIRTHRAERRESKVITTRQFEE